MHLKVEDAPGLRFVEIGGTNMTRTDASYLFRAGSYNAYQLTAEFDRTPHVLGLNRPTMFTEAGRGVFTLAEDTSEVFRDASDRDGIETTVNRLLGFTDLRLKTDTSNLEFRALPLPDLELMATYERREKNGRVPFGGVIGRSSGSVFEFAAPRDEVTHQAGLGAEFVRERYQVRVGYDLSVFDNNIQEIEWDNALGPSFGRASTMPDNVSHTVSGSGGLSLPWWSTRLTGTGTYSRRRQTDQFLPFTTIAGFAGNSTDGGLNNADAQMTMSLANLSVNSRPFTNVSTTLRY